MPEKTTAITGPVVVGLNDKKGEIRLTDGKNVNEAKYLSIAAPDNITSDTTLTFPNGAGTNGQVLTTDGNGGLSWSTSGGSGGNPGGTVGQTQVNDGAGGFGAISEGTSGQVLTSRGAGLAPTFQNATGGGIAAVVDDTSPQLGGDLETNGHDIMVGNTDPLNMIDNAILVGSPQKLRIDYDSFNNKTKIHDQSTQEFVISKTGGATGRMVLEVGNTGEKLLLRTIGSPGFALTTTDGTAGQVLTTDGNGNVNFASPSGGGGSSGTVGQTQVSDGSGGFLGVSEGGSGQVLTSNGSGVAPTFQNAPGGLSAVVDDTSPQLGGNLGLNSQGISGIGDINLIGGSLILRANAPGGTNNGPFIGANTAAGINASSFGNLAIGTNAGRDFGQCTRNIAVGTGALLRTTTGINNTSVGGESMRQNTTGGGNTAVGFQALDNSTGNGNTAIGNSAGSSVTSGQNDTLIGQSAAPSSPTVSNEITLGNSSVATLRCNVTSITSLSDARDKKDVEDVNVGLDFINDLRPVKFVWDTRDGAKKDIKEVGFIAQELDEVQQKHGIEDHLQLVLKNNPDKLEASQGKLIPILVQAIKDLKKEIDELKKA